MQLGRLDHVGVAVADLAAARALYEQVLGLEVTHEEVIEDQGVHELLLSAGDAFVQLVAPLSPDTSVGRFLARRGEGVHHVGYAGRRALYRRSDLLAWLRRAREPGG